MFLLLAFAGRVLAANTTFVTQTCVAVSSGTGVGTKTWTNVPNVTDTNDSTGAQVQLQANTMTLHEVSQYLQCTGLGYSVPTASVIDGIEMTTNRSHQSSNPITIGDAHVFAVAGTTSAIVGTDQAHNCKATMPKVEWFPGSAVNYGPDSYGVGGNNKWGIVPGLAACGSATPTCPNDPTVPGGINVNHANFGVTMDAINCGTASGLGFVDNVHVQVDYTVTACNNNWTAPVTVVPADTKPGATTDYTITTSVPNIAGCALLGSTKITVTLAAGDTSGVGQVVFNTIGQLISSSTATSVTFVVPGGALTAACGAQNCVEAGSPVTIVLKNVKNPTTEGPYTLHVKTDSTTPTLSGAITDTTSSSYKISNGCAASGTTTPSAWPTVAAAAPAAQQSIAGCDNYTTYTVTGTVPSPLGCALKGTQSKLSLKFAPGGATGFDVSKVTSAGISLDGGTTWTKVTSAITASGGTPPDTVTFTSPVDVAPGQTVKIALDPVKNPSAAGSATVTLQATQTDTTVMPDSTAATASPGFSITSTATCTPADYQRFFVRDWSENTSTHDNGDAPDVIPTGHYFWAESDVWNRETDTAGAFDAHDRPAHEAAHYNTMQHNFAYVRFSRRGAAPAGNLNSVTVQADLFLADYGLGSNFAALGSKTVVFSPSDTIKVMADGTGLSWTIPVSHSTDACLGVQLSTTDQSPQDKYTTALNNMPIGTGVVDDPHVTQHNVSIVAPAPVPPPAGGGGGAGAGGAGKMGQYAVIHNAATATRDMTIRYEASPEAVQQLGDGQVGVVEGESAALKPEGTMTLAKMQPGEIRWIALSYRPAPGSEGKTLPVTFSEIVNGKTVNGFTFSVRPARIDSVTASNLRLHAAVFSRMGDGFRIAQATEEGRAAAALREQRLPEEKYLEFLKTHQRPMAAAVSSLLAAGHTSDPFGVAESLKSLERSLGEGSVPIVANAHLALLEKLDAHQTRLQRAKGNLADVLQMVRWQKELFGTAPQLKDDKASGYVVKASEDFMNAWDHRKANVDGYPKLMADCLKSIRAVSADLKKSGVQLDSEVKELEGNLKSPTALEKAHRDYLLKLSEGLAKHETYSK